MSRLRTSFLQEEVQLAAEETGQVLVDEEVGVVAAHVLGQVVLQAADRVFPVVVVLAGQGCEGLSIAVQLLGDCGGGFCDDFVLGVGLAVPGAFCGRKGAVFEWYGDGLALGVPGRFGSAGHEEPPVALDVILLDVGVGQAKVDSHAAGGLPVVVAEVLVGLDVVLVAVGPVEIDLFAVVGNGVAVVAPVAALGDEVPFFVVTAEESMEMVVDSSFDGVAAAIAIGSLDLSFQVFFADGQLVVSLCKIAMVVNSVFTQSCPDSLRHFFEFGRGLGLLGQRTPSQFGGDEGGELFIYELLYRVPLVVHDAVDTEVQVGAVELEQLSKQALELGQVGLGIAGRCGHSAFGPGVRWHFSMWR